METIICRYLNGISIFIWRVVRIMPGHASNSKLMNIINATDILLSFLADLAGGIASDCFIPLSSIGRFLFYLFIYLFMFFFFDIPVVRRL